MDPLLELLSFMSAPATTALPMVLADDGTTPLPEIEEDQGEQVAWPDRIGWEGILGVEGELTGDGRLIEPNSLRWEGLPLPFRYVSSDVGAHDGAVAVGVITSMGRNENGDITGRGWFDGTTPMGREAASQVDKKVVTGVSMDLDDVSFEVRVAADLLDEDGGMLPLMSAKTGDEDADGRITVAEVRSDEEVRVTTSGRIRAATLVAIPAFARAVIHLTGESVEVEDESELSTDDEPLVASSYPVAPPSAWFTNPHFHSVAPLTVTREGRVLGHLAQWNTCHVGGQHQSRCVTAPRSATGYAYFLVGSVLTAEGTEVRVGHITLDTGHAGPDLTAVPAVAHYDNTGCCVADVACGEDEHGIWVSGAVRPNATEERIRALRASPLSGDWRRIGGNLELVAALAVNSPGFPIPRPAGLVASGAKQSLVAVGMVPPKRVLPPGAEGALSLSDLRYLKRLVAREKEADLVASAAMADDAGSLALRVRTSELALRRRSWTPTNNKEA